MAIRVDGGVTDVEIVTLDLQFKVKGFVAKVFKLSSYGPVVRWDDESDRKVDNLLHRIQTAVELAVADMGEVEGLELLEAHTIDDGEEVPI
ncbi:MAG: hypothetical protein KGL39_16490 [Patescibacteria group bacterium]|nr:hypothetical protein [Patescibacteria group bacterium]